MTQVLPRRVPHARPYLSLLLLVPASALLWYGWSNYSNVPDGGTVDAIKLTTKPGFVGQASEAMANVLPETPDLYLKVFAKQGEVDLRPFKSTPVGNGLTWNLAKAVDFHDLQRIEVWDHNMILKDKEYDRISLEGTWDAEGQRFHVQLLGRKFQPPDWAMPVMVAGGVMAGLVLLKFVWDQVV